MCLHERTVSVSFELFVDFLRIFGCGCFSTSLLGGLDLIETSAWGSFNCFKHILVQICIRNVRARRIYFYKGDPLNIIRSVVLPIIEPCNHWLLYWTTSEISVNVAWVQDLLMFQHFTVPFTFSLLHHSPGPWLDQTDSGFGQVAGVWHAQQTSGSTSVYISNDFKHARARFSVISKFEDLSVMTA